MNKWIRLLMVCPIATMVPPVFLSFFTSSDYEQYRIQLDNAKRVRNDAERNADINQTMDNLRRHVEALAPRADHLSSDSARTMLFFAECLLSNYCGTTGTMDRMEEAEKYLRLSAGIGLPEAQYALGRFLFAKAANHPQREELLKEAFNSYTAAAEQGHAEAAFQMGMCQLNGWGSPTDEVAAVESWKKGAEQGSGEAGLRLGMAYESGSGTSGYINVRESIKWYRKAAGCADAQVSERAKFCLRRLGVHY